MAGASFQKEFLETHNAYRAEHNAPQMTLNKELTAAAQQWADHLLATGTLQHSNTKDGENVYNKYSSAPIKLTGKEAVEAWYSEIKDYNWGSPGFNGNTGHFTQVVWKDSTELGVGMATDGKKVFVVGQYRPAGNMMGSFEGNVFPKVPSFQMEFLETHNAYRAEHFTPPMTLNKELTDAAQQWADHLLETVDMQHSKTKDGENIYIKEIPFLGCELVKPTGKEAVEAWYNEIKDYNWSSPGFSSETGHFTQVVWKDSTELGVGMAIDEHRAFVVGQYRPAGNMMGSFEGNVFPKGASFQKEFLETHNAYRAEHNAPPMTLNKELTDAAQQWADRLLATVDMQHSKTKDGENIYIKEIPFLDCELVKPTGKEAVEAWYNEIKDYNWGSPGFSSETGHFTQVVWKDSTELGVGMAIDEHRAFVVGQYRPAGNMMGSFEGNVFPKGASFQKEFLETHNAYRAEHNAPPMTLNKELTDAAQQWADRLLATVDMQHSKTKDGENIYIKEIPFLDCELVKPTGKEAVEAWYSEIKDYNWGSPGFSSETGHFTQVVWKDSTELGVGMAIDEHRAFVVGQYRPAGNMMGSFEGNVFPKGASFQKEFLETHNAYRAEHNAPPMTLNKELTDAAQQWADHLLATVDMQHSKTKDGENIYIKEIPFLDCELVKPTGKEAVEAWYNEIKDYNWSSPGFSSETGRFTQVVWKDSTELGVGMAIDENRVFVVGQYRPAGNMMGSFEGNVFPKVPSFQMEFLETHNAYRAEHFTPPMTLNKELTDAAQQWADHLLETVDMQHSKTKDGENIYIKEIPFLGCELVKPTGKEAVEAWYNEIKDYNWSSPGFSSETGRFTQVVWKDSTELGVGMAIDENRAFVVGQYRPAGNMMGSFEENVLRNGASFQKEFLETHNAYRAEHNAPPMTLNKELTDAAQQWADHLLATMDMQHSKTKDGENIYIKEIPFLDCELVKPTGKEAVEAWYNEIKDYNWGSPGFSSETGHFTQVVWKDSTELGVGMAIDEHRAFVVGQYRPAGNMMGSFEGNVFPKGASFQKEFLETHNAYRAEHNAPPMTLNKELTDAAQQWADHLLATVDMQHSKTKDGENIYIKEIPFLDCELVKPTGKEAVEAWYNEIKDYNWGSPGFSSETGHFTQVVWKDSTELGVGMAIDEHRAFVVGQYRPAGNMMGSFEGNVFPKGASFQKEFLETHNAYRAEHNAPPMTLNKELTDAAQQWADHLLATVDMQHSKTKDGENIYIKEIPFLDSELVKPTGKEAVEAWYNEIKDYNWGSPGFSSETGHFTQVVWKDSTELGVGMAIDEHRAFVVGQYRPAGNMMGSFEGNVFPKGASFQKEFLETHNAYRAEHNAPPMTLNKELTDAAQQWADHLLATVDMQHSKTKDGENIYIKEIPFLDCELVKPTGKEAVQAWYNEIKDYNWSSPGFSSETGHFTQVVWKDSTELGVGMAIDEHRAFVVGQYRPAGNMMGSFEGNVFPKA